MRISFDVQGLAQFTGTLEQAVGRVEGLAGQVVRKTAHDVQADAQTRAPVDTGALRSSIRAAPRGPLAAEVSPSVNYSHYVEFGTSRMAPQPYLLPALDAKTGPFITAMERVAEVALG